MFPPHRYASHEPLNMVPVVVAVDVDVDVDVDVVVDVVVAPVP